MWPWRCITRGCLWSWKVHPRPSLWAVALAMPAELLLPAMTVMDPPSQTVSPQLTAFISELPQSWRLLTLTEQWLWQEVRSCITKIHWTQVSRSQWLSLHGGNFASYPGWSYTVPAGHFWSSYSRCSLDPGPCPPWTWHHGTVAAPSNNSESNENQFILLQNLTYFMNLFMEGNANINTEVDNTKRWLDLHFGAGGATQL